MAGESELSCQARSRLERSCPKEILDKGPDRAEQRRAHESSAPDPRLPEAGRGHRPAEARGPTVGSEMGMLPEPLSCPPSVLRHSARGRAMCSTILAASSSQMV